VLTSMMVEPSAIAVETAIHTDDGCAVFMGTPCIVQNIVGVNRRRVQCRLEYHRYRACIGLAVYRFTIGIERCVASMDVRCLCSWIDVVTYRQPMRKAMKTNRLP